MERTEESIKRNPGEPGLFSGEKVGVFHSTVFSIGVRLHRAHPAFLVNRNIEAEGFHGEARGKYRPREIFSLTGKVKNFIF
ncbi:MAG TPA: hypothetical protein PKC29_08365 [Thermodesulfobacteriota bacterium]|nr:hypothetical protein [Thermodesulfobacteriota bacterium]